MSAKTFERIYKDIISEDKGNADFKKGEDACKVQGATALQKLVSCIRQLAYGNTADIAEEYTSVAENTKRLILLSFCSWVDVVYGPTYLGAWTVEAVRKEMAINAWRGFQECSALLIAPTGVGSSAPSPCRVSTMRELVSARS